VSTTGPLLRLAGLRKSYGAVAALKGVDLAVEAGEVVAICGDNGAGKSTLIRIVSGADAPSTGALELDGKPVVFRSPREALVAGVATIYQDLALAPRLPIWQNVYVGAELTRRLLPGLTILDKREMMAASRRYLARLKVDIADTERAVERLSGGQRQAVAIARAVYWNAQLMIMDEPTAALGVAEQRKVLTLVRTLRERGVGVLIISHNMQDVLDVADRVIVMRRGRAVGERRVSETDASELLGLIIGAERFEAA